MMAKSALAGIRVLELSGLYGAYCGKLFADLGASVTLVEPPGGSPMRRKPPFAGDVPGPDNSLAFAYFAANKDSVVLDFASEEGMTSLTRLAADAHLVILADHPAFGRVDLDKLCEANPALVSTRITPFGASGPYAHMTGDDLTLMAMGGLLTMAGFPDAAPVVAYGEQGVLAADQFAAVASLTAILHAEQTGQGELIDVSIQESIVMALENAAQVYQLEGRVRNRTGRAKQAGTGIYKCQDGEIYLLAGGIGDTQMWGNFAEWMEAEGVAGAALFASPDWNDKAAGAEEAFGRVFLPYAAGKTKAELYVLARQWRVPMAPMSMPPDLLDNAQLAYRGFFVPSPSGTPLAGVRMPGAPYKLGETPWALRSAAPRLGSPTASNTAKEVTA
ncbi:CaiB/BaiF CoA transferase family protein [Xanthobacter autotrophicus]|uniref:CaiB/BaiF CoA transferase family protein n=1 Tax=Xanthobacter autotrophicus TaxID=280 RepID=UPI0024A61D73|nr:CoA transferase [Xanthobacter autotrophicus]MDI4655131.1 CoA transferase [Xanthobacter autotrophicus]